MTQAFYTGGLSLETSGGGGSSAVLIEKSITQNGTYNAGFDDADGYSQVTVNVEDVDGLTRKVNASGLWHPVTNFKLPTEVKTIMGYGLYYAFRNRVEIVSADMSSLERVTADYALAQAFEGCTNLASIDLSNLQTVTAQYGLNSMCSGCTKLTSLDLHSLKTVSGSFACGGMFFNCKGLTSINVSGLETLTGNYCFQIAFQGCNKLTSVTFDSLKTVTADHAMYRTFRNCTSLKHIYFPSFTSSTFGSVTNQFASMLEDVTGCTVHMPSNVETAFGTRTFFGSGTVILFDLEPTE